MIVTEKAPTFEQIPSYLLGLASEIHSLKEIINTTALQPALEVERPIDVSGAAEFVNMDEQTIYRLVRSRQIPFHKRSKLYFFKSELNAWIKAGKGKIKDDLEAEAESSFLSANKNRKG